MIKTIIFDMDGVLVDAKEIHFQALNQALADIGEHYVISREEHLTIYDGIPTIRKLELLAKYKGFPIEKSQEISIAKQKYTIDGIFKYLNPDREKKLLLQGLEADGYRIIVASNSIRETVKRMLRVTGLIDYVDRFYGNEDVKLHKPHPELYIKIMSDFSLKPSETLIVEDSFHGREAAMASGAILCPIDRISDVTYERINEFIKKGSNNPINRKWDSSEINVLIPMAGAGSRFSVAGYTFPKPLIEVGAKPMIQVVVENLNINAKFTYIVQKEHYEKYNLKYLLNLITPNCNIVQVDKLTEGAACTTLLAKDFINFDKPLLIANSDQFVDWDSTKFYYSMTADNIDGGILTFQSTHPKWSFVKLDENNYITEVAEKKPISDIATVGIYYWSYGSDYVKYAEQMINNNVRINNEFYVAPVYNEAIADGKKFKTFNIDKMWGLGTPEDLHTFLENHKH